MSKPIIEAYFSKDVSAKQPHYHDCHQIIYVTKGEIKVCINDVSYNVVGGEMVIFSRYEAHSISVVSEEYERYVLRIDPTADSRENRIYSLLSNRPSGFCNVLAVGDGKHSFDLLFKEITEEYADPQKLTEDMLELLTNQLLIKIYRQLPESLSLLEENNFEMVSGIQRRFESSCAKQYSLTEIAKEYNISVSSLSHQFKRITGVSVMDYLLSCRLAAAKRYLTETGLSISEIVERCGFSDSSNFSRTFKRLNGTTPSQFRCRYAGGNGEKKC
ncbi:MAG: AraC family transcriptional regulator [Oscillospiraceae bacterium]|nr:AraC family transcriptional regulator [Oscillospiraceae bacterium]MBQ3048707.1 AraC family transcriptional regulator [Oscillospiraceae bacterium]MBQ9939801.1 AraC family transcriptional regulator [Oscillospiraceae bacterium]